MDGFKIYIYIYNNCSLSQVGIVCKYGLLANIQTPSKFISLGMKWLYAQSYRKNEVENIAFNAPESLLPSIRPGLGYQICY